ncbi:MAG: tetrahydromethanopterin S-methyltransferase subunit H [Promethearchaeota archaeon]
MMRFSASQESFDIAGIHLGGQPGITPTVLIASLFYKGHKVVSSPKTGRFNRKRARELLLAQDQVSQKTGNPYMLDVVGDTPEAMKQYIDFVAKETEAPFLVDSASATTRIEAIRYVAEIGLISRVVYNSLMPSCRPEELTAIQEVKLEQAVLLAYDKQLATTKGRITAITTKEETGLLPIAQKSGVTKPLIDTCVLDIPSLGMACRAIYELKNQFGLVCGCGAHNAVETWRGLTIKFREGLRETGVVSSALLAVASGADFVLYGPIEHAEAVFPMVAMVDAAWGQVAFEENMKIGPKHPLFRIA